MSLNIEFTITDNNVLKYVNYQPEYRVNTLNFFNAQVQGKYIIYRIYEIVARVGGVDFREIGRKNATGYRDANDQTVITIFETFASRPSESDSFLEPNKQYLIQGTSSGTITVEAEPVATAQATTCETGKGQYDNSSLQSGTCNGRTASECNNYYESDDSGSSYRCKYSGTSGTSGTSCTRSDNTVTETSSGSGIFCSSFAVFHRREELKAAVDNIYNDRGVNTALDTTATTATYGSVNAWDTSQVKNMISLFKDKNITDNNIQAWNTSGVLYADTMFEGAVGSTTDGSTTDISNWDMNQVENCFNFNRNSDITKPTTLGDNNCQIPYIPNMDTATFQNLVTLPTTATASTASSTTAT